MKKVLISTAVSSPIRSLVIMKHDGIARSVGLFAGGHVHSQATHFYLYTWTPN